MHRIGSRYSSVLGAAASSPFRTTKRLSLESLECRQVMSAAAIMAESPVLLDTTPTLTLAPQQLLSTGMPLGNYVMLPTRGNIFVPSGALADPEIAGFVIRDTWSNVNPAPGVYNWSRIDGAISKIVAAGKSFKLSIYAGVETPTWVYDAGAQSMQFYESDGSRPAGWYTMAVPWDSTMLQAYGTLLGAMSAKYASSPALAMVELGGPTRFSLEMHLPEEVVNQPGYSTTAVVNAWSTVLNTYRSVFPNTYGSIALANPVPGVSNGVAAQVAANAVSILGPRAALQHNAMSAKSSLLTYNIHELVSQYGAQGVMVGYEEVASSKDARFGGSFATAWQRVLAGSGKFFDIYVPDDAIAQPFPGLTVNRPPSFVTGPNISTSEDVGSFAYPGWATAISTGSPSEIGQALTFEITGNSNPGLFAVAPMIDSGGALRFTPAANAYGTAKLSVVLRDNGGTASGGVNTSIPATFTISVSPTNDAPRLDTGGSPALNSINANPANNTGTMVSSLLSSGASGNPISDVDVGAKRGIAIVLAETANGSWQYSLDSGASWLPLGNATTLAARLLIPDSASRIRFVPNLNFVGSARIFFRAWDQTTGVAGGTADTSLYGGTTAFSTGVESATVLVGTSAAATFQLSASPLVASATLAAGEVTSSVDSQSGDMAAASATASMSSNKPRALQPTPLSNVIVDAVIERWKRLDELGISLKSVRQSRSDFFWQLR